MPKAKKEQEVFNGTGRRKSSIARVRIMSGKGNITVNGKSLDEYFGEETLKVIVRQPLTVTDTLDKYDVIATVKGGGFSGQAGAVRHGIARALNAANLEYRPALKSNGFLTRDSRAKELKKGDIIAFKEGDIVITHRIDEVVIEDGNVKYITKGDNNNTQDIGYVLPEQVEGVYQFKVARLGNLAMFIQTPIGMIVCLSIPVIIIVLLQAANSKKEKEELIARLNNQNKMEEEIEKLKKQNEELMKK